MRSTSADQQLPPATKDLVVFDILRDSECADCGQEMSHGEFLFLEGNRPLCLRCADLDHLVYLPRGDTALTRRAAAQYAIGGGRSLQPGPWPIRASRHIGRGSRLGASRTRMLCGC